jgi:photosystem II stability/assembly factor-like uncharacterized protein
LSCGQKQLKEARKLFCVGRIMKTSNLCLRDSLLTIALTAGYLCLAPGTMSQQTQTSEEKAASSNNFPAAKAQPPRTASRDAGVNSGNGAQHEPDKAETDSPEAIGRREDWFYKQRASVSGRIPGGARLKALQHMQRMMAAEGKLLRRPDGSFAEVTPLSGSASAPVWTSIGPAPTTGGVFSPVTGRITTIAVDPSDATGNTVLIGGAQGGIWRSTDAGNTWTAVGDQNASLAMGSIAFAPSSPTTVYAGTGEQASIGFDIYYGAGVLKSTDHGQTWTQTCAVAGPTCPFIGPYLDSLNPSFGFFNFGGARISYVAVNPSNPNVVLVAAQLGIEGPTEGIYCSSNGGATWTNIFPDEMATFVGFASPTVAFAGFGMPFGSSPNAPHGNGIYKSTNANTCSATFTPVAAGLPPQSSIGRIEMGISPNYASDSTVYASVANGQQASTTNLGVWVTNNGGTSWTQTNAPDICQHQCWYDNVLKVDPTNKNTVFFGGSAVVDSGGNPNWVVRTTNGGTAWSAVVPNQVGPGLPHVDTHALAFFKLPSGKVRLYLGNDGGIWRTDDAEASAVQWTNLNGSTLTLTQFYPMISIHTSTPSIAFGGTQDNSSQQLAIPPSWVTNTGTFQTPSGPVQGEVCGDGTSTAIDPLVPSTVYISCQFTSVNASYQTGAAGSFFPAVNGIDPTEAAGFVPPLVADPNQANVVYFATTRIYQSQDAANSWTPISPFLTGGSDTLTSLAIGAQTSSVIYAGANTGAVFVATGFTNGSFIGFQQSNPANSSARGVTALAVDPSDTTGMTAYASYTGFAYVGPDALNPNINISDPMGHIFKSTNGGQTWTDISCSTPDCSKPAVTDLPNIPVNDVVVDPDIPGTIYAATDLGVYVTTCTAAPCTWTTLATGLPHVAVLSMRLHEPSRTLRAATHGRGAWDLVLNNFAFSGPHISSITPTSVNSGAPAITLTVSGSGLTGGTVNLGGAALAATGTQTDTQLSANIPTNLLTAGSPKVTVTTGTATSNAVPFEVLSLTPTLSSCTSSAPAATTASCGTPVQSGPSASVQLALNGSNFAAGAKTLFNGAYSGIGSQTNNNTKLTATLPGTLLGPFGSTNDVSVLNTPPGGGKSTVITFQVVAPPPSNDTINNALTLTGLTLFAVQDSSNAAADPSDPAPPCANQFTTAEGNTGGHPNGTYNSVWYKYTTPAVAANLELDTIGSSYDTVLSMWTGTAGNLTNVACNDDIQRGVIQSQIPALPLAANTTYYIMVSSFGPPDPNPIALGGKTQLFGRYNGGLNPSGTITSLSPTSAASDGQAFALTVNGSDFLNGASVFFNNVQEPTTFVSSTQLTTTISAADIVLPGTYTVFIANPAPSDTSGSVDFTVTVGTYPVPVLKSIGPTSVVAGGFAFPLGATGSDFAQTAVLNFNGVPVPTSIFGTQGLSGIVPATAISNPGPATVTVSNPTPGGGTSQPLQFTIATPSVVPTITSLSPSSASSGTSITPITISGTNFQQGALVYLNGDSFNQFITTPTFVSSTQLTMNIFLSSFNPGTFSVIVGDPAPAGFSNAATFTVTGPPDFSFTVAAGQGSQTVNAGQTATFTNVIAVTALNGFTGQVAVTCTSPAQATTCAVNPATLNAGQSASVMVTTTVRALTPPLWNRRIISWPRALPILLLTIVLCCLLTRWAHTRRQRFAAAVPLAGLVLFLILQAVGCGGGSSQPPPPPPPTGTQAGTYTITVTGASGATNTTHAATLQLIVN